MRVGLARRQAALAGVALVGALGAIALTRIDGEDATAPPPQAVVEWEEARVGVLVVQEEVTACGIMVEPVTVGVAHPVLPCGAQLVLERDGVTAQAEVVASGPVGAGHAFDLTPALAQQLGVAGEDVVRWRFAGE
ncbi:MAG: hypothetical protein ACRDNI_06105 [Gaiellaceae bacterium]